MRRNYKRDGKGRFAKTNSLAGRKAAKHRTSAARTGARIGGAIGAVPYVAAVTAATVLGGPGSGVFTASKLYIPGAYYSGLGAVAGASVGGAIDARRAARRGRRR